MPFAVMLFFDSDLENRIKSVWHALSENGIDSYLDGSGNRPHIKLAIFEELGLGESQSRLRTWARSATPLSVEFKHFGVFPQPKPTIFLGPAVTQPVLALKQEVDAMLKDLGTYPSYDFFQPEHWIPHCLLALEVEQEKLTKGLEVVMRMPIPLAGKITEIGVIKFFPVKNLFEYALGT
jgi:2'-5' RNA ligase